MKEWVGIEKDCSNPVELNRGTNKGIRLVRTITHVWLKLSGYKKEKAK